MSGINVLSTCTGHFTELYRRVKDKCMAKMYQVVDKGMRQNTKGERKGEKENEKGSRKLNERSRESK